MASQSLYRKWRSQTFEEIVGQQRVTRTLLNAIRTKRLSHAYLFCGPRGIGKTSAARVLAKAVNCTDSVDGEPCNACPTCVAIGEGRSLDVIEIDAASNRGIDEMRDLREKVNFSPTQATYKFYILDEVHMLTSEAFNALLKTLEEPPRHAVFVLVTTEPHRLPATILSRCQRFDFHRIGLPDLAARLRHICEAEKIEIDNSALEAVGRLATGSLRDAESLLDQLVSYCGNRITLDDVHMVMGMTGSKAARELAGFIVDGDIPSGLRLIGQVAGDGADLRQFSREVVEYLRGLMVLKVGGGADLLDVPDDTLQDMQRLVDKTSAELLIRAIRIFTAAEISQRMSLHVQLPVELAFVEAVLPVGKQEGIKQPSVAPPVRPSSPAPKAGWERTVADARPAAAVHSPSPVFEQPEVASPAPKPKVEQASELKKAVHGDEEGPTVAPASTPGDLREKWVKVIEKCGAVSKSAQAVLRSCELAGLAGGVAHLEVASPFHLGQVEDPKTGAIVASLLGEVLGEQVQIRCKIRPKDKKKTTNWPMDDPLVKTAIEQHGARIKKVEVTRGDAS